MNNKDLAKMEYNIGIDVDNLDLPNAMKTCITNSTKLVTIFTT